MGNSLRDALLKMQAANQSKTVVEQTKEADIINKKEFDKMTNDETIVINLRKTYGGAIASYPDEMVAKVYADWSMSGDFDVKSTFLTWLFEEEQGYENTSVEGVITITSDLHVADVEAIEEIEQVLSEESEEEDSDTSDEDEGIAEIEMAGSIPIQGISAAPLVENESESDAEVSIVTAHEVLTQKQWLSVMVDHLREQAEEATKEQFADLLARLYKVDTITETGVMTSVAESFRVRDLLFAMFKSLEIAIPTVHSLPYTVEVDGKTITIANRNGRYFMRELEAATVNAVSEVSRLRSAKVNLLKANGQIESLTSKIDNYKTAIEEHKATIAALNTKIESLSKIPSAEPILYNGETTMFFISWPVKVKDSEETTTMFLSIDEAAEQDENGNYSIEGFRRTKEITSAIFFPSKDRATKILAYIAKNGSKLSKESRIKEASIKKMAVSQLAAIKF